MPMYNLIEYSGVIQRHQEVYGNTLKMNQLETIITKLLIFLQITKTIIHLNLNKKQRNEQETGTQNILKVWFH